jgi:hypothetical protein
MAGTSSAKTRFALIPGHDESETSVPAKLYEFEILIIQLQLRSQKLRRADERSVIRHSRMKGPEYAEARHPRRPCADTAGHTRRT